jgi:hypothetical protein
MDGSFPGMGVKYLRNEKCKDRITTRHRRPLDVRNSRAELNNVTVHFTCIKTVFPEKVTHTTWAQDFFSFGEARGLVRGQCQLHFISTSA